MAYRYRRVARFICPHRHLHRSLRHASPLLSPSKALPPCALRCIARQLGAVSGNVCSGQHHQSGVLSAQSRYDRRSPETGHLAPASETVVHRNCRRRAAVRGYECAGVAESRIRAQENRNEAGLSGTRNRRPAPFLPERRNYFTFRNIQRPKSIDWHFQGKYKKPTNPDRTMS